LPSTVSAALNPFAQFIKRLGEQPHRNQNDNHANHDQPSDYLDAELRQFLKIIRVLEDFHAVVQVTSTIVLAPPNELS